MQKILQTILLVLLSGEVCSQQLSVGFQTGSGTYSMRELKALNGIIKDNLPFHTKIVADFPPYFNYSVSILFKAGKISAGPVYTFLSTGSRVSAKDFSGEYRFDMLINSNTAAIYGMIDLLQKGKFLCSFYTSFGFMYSNLETNEFAIVRDTTFQDETNRFRSFNLYSEHGFMVTYPLKLFNVGLNAGYSLQYNRHLFRYNENREIYLVNPVSKEPIKPGWNGLRIGLSIFYTIRLHQKHA